jgi:hypothetical protein
MDCRLQVHELLTLAGTALSAIRAWAISRTVIALRNCTDVEGYGEMNQAVLPKVFALDIDGVPP